MSLFFFYLFVGSVAGVFSGLLGIGGGLVFVPALHYTLRGQNFSSDILIQVVIATSLASIIFTSVSAIFSHKKYGHIHWIYVKRLALGLVVGAFLGTHIALMLTGKLLEVIFGCFVFLMAVQMLLSYQFAEKHRPERLQARILVPSGSFIGACASLLGISGGSLVVPFLNWRGLPLAQATSIAAVTNLVLAASAAFFYTLHQPPAFDVPEYGMLGWVYWPALLGLVLGSMPAARVGVYLSQRLPALWLRCLFILFLTGIGIDFVFFHA